MTKPSATPTPAGATTSGARPRRRRKRGSGGIVLVREGVYRVDIELKRDPLTGMRRRVSRQIEGTHEDAEIALRAPTPRRPRRAAYSSRNPCPKCSGRHGGIHPGRRDGPHRAGPEDTRHFALCGAHDVSNGPGRLSRLRRHPPEPIHLERRRGALPGDEAGGGRARPGSAGARPSCPNPLSEPASTDSSTSIRRRMPTVPRPYGRSRSLPTRTRW